MDPKTRYKLERKEGKLQREEIILEAAERVFIRRGIEKTTMQNIAEEANIGIATLFRYFPRKEKLVVAVATQKIDEIRIIFEEVSGLPISCLDKLDRLFDYFITPIAEERDQHIKFLEDFDSCAAHAEKPLEDIDQFNKVYRKVSAAYASIIEEGKHDGSLRGDLSVPEVLTTIINTFSNFSKKLSIQRRNVELDVEPVLQLAILKKIFLEYLKA